MYSVIGVGLELKVVPQQKERMRPKMRLTRLVMRMSVVMERRNISKLVHGTPSKGGRGGGQEGFQFGVSFTAQVLLLLLLPSEDLP